MTQQSRFLPVWDTTAFSHVSFNWWLNDRICCLTEYGGWRRGKWNGKWWKPRWTGMLWMVRMKRREEGVWAEGRVVSSNGLSWIESAFPVGGWTSAPCACFLWVIFWSIWRSIYTGSIITLLQIHPCLIDICSWKCYLISQILFSGLMLRQLILECTIYY